MLTKFKSTIIKQRGIRKAAKQEAGGGADCIPPSHPAPPPPDMIQLLISAGETEDSRPVQFV